MTDFFQLALEEARGAEAHGDIPVGAVLVKDGKILASAHNRREADADPTGHAEVIALRAGAKQHGHWNLTGAELYITLEPCPMCLASCMLARLKAVHYLAEDAKGGALSLGIHVHQHAKLNHRFPASPGGTAEQREEAAQLLKDFFRKKRADA